jgi:hypothetical protein
LKVVDVVQREDGAGEMEAVDDDVLVAALPDSMVVRVVTVVTAERVCDCAFALEAAGDVLLLDKFTLFLVNMGVLYNVQDLK